MKLTVLGKYGPYPKAGGGTSSYLLECGSKKFLLDAGSGCLSRLQQYFALSEVDAIFLSHLHSDHCSDLLIWRYIQMEPIDLWLPGTPKTEFNMFDGCGRFRTHRINDGMQIQIDGIDISFCHMIHPVECYAIKFSYGGKTFVYSGDGIYSEALTDFAQSADGLLIDSGFLGPVDEHKNLPHMFVSQAALIAKKAKVSKLYLTHINPEYDEELIQQEAALIFENCLVVQEQTSYNI